MCWIHEKEKKINGSFKKFGCEMEKSQDCKYFKRIRDYKKVCPPPRQERLKQVYIEDPTRVGDNKDKRKKREEISEVFWKEGVQNVKWGALKTFPIETGRKKGQVQKAPDKFISLGVGNRDPILFSE